MGNYRRLPSGLYDLCVLNKEQEKIKFLLLLLKLIYEAVNKYVQQNELNKKLYLSMQIMQYLILLSWLKKVRVMNGEADVALE